MTRSTHHPWLNRFAWLTAAGTFLLIGLGGLVTSHEAGMSVPDWPTSYGYNMFLFPLSQHFTLAAYGAPLYCPVDSPVSCDLGLEVAARVRSKFDSCQA